MRSPGSRLTIDTPARSRGTCERSRSGGFQRGRLPHSSRHALLTPPHRMALPDRGLQPVPVRVLRLAFDEWEDDRDSDSPRPAIHREWIRFVLKETLGLPGEVLAEGQDIPQTLKAKISEHGETLRPDVVVHNP